MHIQTGGYGRKVLRGSTLIRLQSTHITGPIAGCFGLV
jgi:hypothetical protein